MEKSKNILIVNFNTQKFTEACIKSVNKTTPGCTIYVFDNSDKEKFVNTFDNVRVLDNTNNEIVDFDSILEKQENRFQSGGHVNNFGSFKHCLSVDACFDLIPNGFVLLDSDVLVKKNLSPLFDESCISVGAVEKLTHFKTRFAPYVMYINTAMCLEKGIRFYNENHMFGFKSSSEAEDYDTGCWFYEAIHSCKKKTISYKVYVLHFRAGSWLEDAKTKHKYKTMEPDKWLNKNKMYWDDTQKEEIDKLEPAAKEQPGHNYRPKYIKKPKRMPVCMPSLVSTSSGRKVSLIRY